MLFCERGDVGRLIGKGGKNIHEMERQTGCVISIDQKFAPPKVTIKTRPGLPPNAVRECFGLVSDLLDDFELDRRDYSDEAGGSGGQVVGVWVVRGRRDS